MRRLVELRSLVRRLRLMTYLRVVSLAKSAKVDLDIASDVNIGPRFRVHVDRGSRNRLAIGRGSVLGADITLFLRGGTVDVGPGGNIRKGAVLNISGTLRLEENNHISYYSVIHCADLIHFEPLASASEHVVIVDSRHFQGDPEVPYWDNLETGPVRLGRNVWLATKASVLMGVTIGDEAIVAAHAVVTRDVPARAVVGGIPARLIRQG